MSARLSIVAIAGPTASGKSGRGVEEALARGGEIISVDSRQVYRTLDIGTEKITEPEMRGIPHHLIDIREPEESYSAGEFVKDAADLIEDIHARGKLPILVGGTHFYFDALLHGLPLGTDADPELRERLEAKSTEELFDQVKKRDPRRAVELDPKNRRRLIRALEIIEMHGSVPLRESKQLYNVEWIVLNPESEILRERIDMRLREACARGLVDEVALSLARVGDVRLNEFGLEYRVVGEYLRGKRDEASLLPTLSSRLWQYARRQKAWLRKLSADTRSSP